MRRWRRVSGMRLVAVGWLPHQEPVALGVLSPDDFMLPAARRDGRLLHVQGGAATGDALLRVARGGVYGIWSSTLFGSGGAIQWQRWQGTLELLVAAPAPFVLVLLPLTLATSSIGIYSLVATLFWGRFAVRDPVLDRAARSRSPSSCRRRSSGSACSGCSSPRPSSSTGTRTRSRTCSSGRCCSSPGCSCRSRSLPGWSHPSPGYSRRPGACRRFATRRSAATRWPAIGMTLGLGLVYLALGTVFLRYFEVRARKQATLSLT